MGLNFNQPDDGLPLMPDLSVEELTTFAEAPKPFEFQPPIEMTELEQTKTKVDAMIADINAKIAERQQRLTDLDRARREVEADLRHLDASYQAMLKAFSHLQRASE